MTEQADCMAPQPTAEHARLKESAGTWSVDCTFFMDPSGEPMQNTATEVVEMVGDFWTVSRFTCDFMGMPFEGRATLGYDPASGKWISSWIDSMSTFLFKFDGGYDAEGKVLTMTGKGPFPGSGSPDLTDFRTTEEQVDPDTRKFEMFITMPDGTENKMMSYVYSRQR